MKDKIYISDVNSDGKKFSEWIDVSSLGLSELVNLRKELALSGVDVVHKLDSIIYDKADYSNNNIIRKESKRRVKSKKQLMFKRRLDY